MLKPLPHVLPRGREDSGKCVARLPQIVLFLFLFPHFPFSFFLSLQLRLNPDTHKSFGSLAGNILAGDTEGMKIEERSTKTGIGMMMVVVVVMVHGKADDSGGNDGDDDD